MENKCSPTKPINIPAYCYDQGWVGQAILEALLGWLWILGVDLLGSVQPGCSANDTNLEH